MATKKTAVKKVTIKKNTVEVKTSQSRIIRPARAIKNTVDEFLARRPHRSFQRTRRRDYVRSLKLPGFISFTYSVQKTLWQYKKTFILLVVIYAILSGLMVGLASQATYTTLLSTLKSTGGNVFTSGWGPLGQASLLFASTITGSISGSLSQIQQVYAGILGLMAWLTTVWLLRNILAGHKVKLRDGLYSSGAPILPTFMVSLVLVVQLIPIAVALIGYGAASQTGLLNNGIEAFLFWVVAAFLAVLSLYWITSTIFALIVVTLPGMYPYQAIKTAGDLVIGRRIRILYRFLWMALLVILFWVIIMLPVILIDAWITDVWSSFSNVPVIPILLLLMSSLTVVWVSSYVYLLYRKVVADDAKPAL